MKSVKLYVKNKFIIVMNINWLDYFIKLFCELLKIKIIRLN